VVRRRSASWWAFLLFTGAIVAVLLWVVLALFGGGMDIASQVAGIVSAVFAAVALVLQFRGHGPAASSDLAEGDARLDAALRLLAFRAQELSQQEERHWRMDDPRPLRVSWRPASDDVFDHWENIGTGVYDGRGQPLPLTADLFSVREVYRSIPSGRLVIMGRAGAGKTVLAHRLMLELFDHPEENVRVPVLFSMSNWNPRRTGLVDMLADRLTRDYTFLAGTDATGTTFARTLLRTGRILPVLDGFDEIRQHHHAEAISEISRFTGPLVLTTRSQEYIAAVHATRAPNRAATIELEDVTLDEARRYLRVSSNKTRAARWDAIFTYLAANPCHAASRNLVDVLRTPLLVMLVRTTYNDVPNTSPEELLDIGRFPTRHAVEDHLFSVYLSALYDPRHTSHRPVWTDHQARRWLRFLARHLVRLNTHDLAWWQLDATLSRFTRVLVTGIVAAPLGAVIGILSYFIADYLAGGGDYIGQVSQGMLETGTGFAAGLAAGLINELRARTRRVPQRLRLRPTRLPEPMQAFRGLGAEIATGLTAGIVFSLASWLIYGFADGFSEEVASNFVYALAPAIANELPTTGMGIHVAAGLVLGLAVGISYAVVNLIVHLLTGPNDQDSAVSTWELLASDRAVTLFRAGMIGFTVFLVNLIWVRNGYGEASLFDRQGVLYGLLYGLFALLTRLLVSSWGGRWLIFARLWLPLTGQLPWRLHRFLDDAYNRGVLRQAGAVYQFRHAHLRDYLANQYVPEQRSRCRFRGRSRVDLHRPGLSRR
jgi:hypothetical protein